MARVKNIAREQKKKWTWRENNGREIILSQMVLIDVNTGKPLEKTTVKTNSKP